MAGTSNVLGTCSKFNCRNRFGNQISRVRTENVHSKHSIRFRVSQNLDTPLGSTNRLGSAVRQKGEHPFFVGCSRVFQLFFRFSHARNLGVRVNNPRNRVIIDMAIFARQSFGTSDTLFFGFVCQHGTWDTISHSINSRNRSLKTVGINRDKPTLISGNIQIFQPQIVRIRESTDRKQHPIALDWRLSITFDNTPPTHHTGRCHTHPQAKIETLLLQDFLGLGRNLSIHAGEDSVQIFQDGHLGAQPSPNTAEFKSNDTGSDHDQVLRNIWIRQRLGTCPDQIAINFDTF